jgi:hypothetical protein
MAQISSTRTVSLNEIFHNSLQSFQASGRIVPQLMPICFHGNPLQFIIDELIPWLKKTKLHGLSQQANYKH